MRQSRALWRRPRAPSSSRSVRLFLPTSSRRSTHRRPRARQDLLAAARQLLAGAKGSFGLVLSHSLDAGDAGEVVMAARGQTMSVAVYPHLGSVLFGSEASATKAAMNMPSHSLGMQGWDEEGPIVCEDAFRFDLDAVNGEVLLLKWGQPVQETDEAFLGARDNRRASRRRSWVDKSPLVDDESPRVLSGGEILRATEVMRYAKDKLRLVAFNKVEGEARKAFWPRVVRMYDNPLIMPLLPRVPDPVGKDLLDLPVVLERIASDWDDQSDSLNRISAWTFANKLKVRASRTGMYSRPGPRHSAPSPRCSAQLCFRHGCACMPPATTMARSTCSSQAVRSRSG